MARFLSGISASTECVLVCWLDVLLPIDRPCCAAGCLPDVVLFGVESTRRIVQLSTFVFALLYVRVVGFRMAFFFGRFLVVCSLAIHGVFCMVSFVERRTFVVFFLSPIMPETTGIHSYVRLLCVANAMKSLPTFSVLPFFFFNSVFVGFVAFCRLVFSSPTMVAALQLAREVHSPLASLFG